MTTATAADRLLDLIAAHLDALDAEADRFARLGMPRLAARLRVLRDRLEDGATAGEETPTWGTT